MLIAQISDCHIRSEESPFDHLVNSTETLERVVAHLMSRDITPDVLLATGDLTESGAEEEYSLLLELLAPIEIPVLPIPGNHDEGQQFRQALTNLFQNSIDSIHENLDKSQGHINIFTKKYKNRLYLIVEDNGLGFPEEKETLTNPYVTLRSNGTGLGLSIVQRIMEEHNGKLILENTKNGGARVKLEFIIS